MDLILVQDRYTACQKIYPALHLPTTKIFFDEAGLEYPDPENPYTWEEFADVCQKLTKDKDGDGEIDQWGVANANAFGFTPYVYGNGGQFLNDDQTKVVIDENQNFKDAFQYYTDLTFKV